MNKKLIIGISAFVILLICSFAFLNKKTEQKTFEVTKGNMIESTFGVGTVKSDQVYNLKTGVNTKMLERNIKIGQRVKKGQALVRLETFPVYTAPFDGVITNLNYEVGELVFSSSTVLTLVNDKSLYLELNLDEKSINKIKVGNLAKVSFDNQKVKTEGKVRSIFSNSDQFYVHVDFKQGDLFLLPGMTCDVSIITNEFNDAILVPIEAINENDQIRFKDHKKGVLKLDVVFKNSSYAAVSNLHEGDELIPVGKIDDQKATRNNKNKSGH